MQIVSHTITVFYSPLFHKDASPTFELLFNVQVMLMCGNINFIDAARGVQHLYYCSYLNAWQLNWLSLR